MVCFCKDGMLTTTSANFSIRAVPPQLSNLLALLDLEPIEGPRIDERLGEALPANSNWLNATLRAQAPGIYLPSPLFVGGSLMLSAMMQLNVAANFFTLNQPKLLLAEMIQSINSAMTNLMPQLQPMLMSPGLPGIQSMALAARLTLALRAKGVCPMTLAKVDIRAQFAMSSARLQAALALAANFPRMRIPPFALPSAKLALAQQLAAMAPAAATPVGLPALTWPNFMGAMRAQLRMLAAMPVPRIGIPPEALSLLNDLDVINEAFGSDALTPAGIFRVNAMLKFMATLKIPLPLPAMDLKAKLDLVPPFDAVMTGMESASSSGASLSAALTASFSLPPIIPALGTLGTLSGLMVKSFDIPPFGPCDLCNFPLDDIMSNLPDVPLPDPPSFEMP